MKKFIAYASMTTILKIEIEANSEEEAWQIAKETDGGDFTEIEGAGSWHINRVDAEDGS